MKLNSYVVKAIYKVRIPNMKELTIAAFNKHEALKLAREKLLQIGIDVKPEAIDVVDTGRLT